MNGDIYFDSIDFNGLLFADIIVLVDSSEIECLLYVSFKS